MKKYAEKFYKSKTWQATREAYSKSVSYLCEDCLKQGFIVPGEIVHHIKPITQKNIADPNITLAWENLRLLCRPCHDRAHKKTPRRYTVDDHGHILPIGESPSTATRYPPGRPEM